ncbi:MFS transporter [Streptomyces sp. RKND-216]|uniref:MFS transporter n=1 Tax=Streptomyces sp. RKND-216 TaxID=2562581 RepID=UPI00109D9876|nr:MFS transporter [Streptomyces sp. RKND-216]THA24484.1 MFS transporter [Streptomyces sp. RKND-216]
MASRTAGSGRAPAGYSSRERAVIAAAALSMFIVQMDWFALNLTLPVIARDFDTSVTDLQWLVSGYMLTLGALMITGGRLADLWGRRRIILIGLAGFAVVSVVCAAAQNPGWLITARVVQGTAAAVIFPVAVPVVASLFDQARLARAVSTVLAFSAVGTAVGPFVGGALAEHVSWRAVFLVNVPLCAAAMALVLRFVRESRDAAAVRQVDVPGVLTVAGGLVCVMLAFDRGEAWGWASARTVLLMAAGAVLLALFVLLEARVRNPLIDLALFRNGPFDVVTLAGSLSNAVYALIAVLAALYLQEVRGLSPLEAGLVFLALSGGSGGASYWAGRLAERWRAEGPMAAGMLTSGVALLVLTWVQPLGWYTVVFAVCGVGVGLGWSLTNVATQSYVQERDRAAASGIVLTSLVLLGAVAVAVAASVLEVVSGAASTAGADGPAIEAVLRGASVLAFAGAAGLLVLLRRSRHRGPTGR